MKQKRCFGKLLHILMMCLILSVFCTVPVLAANAPACEKTHYLFTSNTGYLGLTDMIFIKNTKADTKITSITTNSKLITGKADIYGDQAVIRLSASPKAKNGANALITAKVKSGNKTYTLKCKVVLKKTAPFKKVSVGGKNIVSSTSNNSGTYMIGEELTGCPVVKAGKAKKIQFTPYANAKVNTILYIGKNTIKRVKNGTKMNLNKGDQLIVFYSYGVNNISPKSFLCDNATEGFFGITVK